MARHRSSNGLGGQRRRRRHRIVVRAAGLLHAREQRIGILDPEPLAPRALGRRLIEVRIPQQLAQYFSVRFSAPRALAAPIVRRVGIDAPGDGVDHRDAGSGVERERALGDPAARHPGDVRHAADVEQPAPVLLVAEQHHVGERHERRPLPSRRHVTRAKVADDAHAHPLGQHGGIAELERRTSRLVTDRCRRARSL